MDECCCELHPEPPEDMTPHEKWEYWNAARRFHSEESVRYAQEAVKYAEKSVRYSKISLTLILISVILMTVSLICRYIV